MNDNGKKEYSIGAGTNNGKPNRIRKDPPEVTTPPPPPPPAPPKPKEEQK